MNARVEHGARDFALTKARAIRLQRERALQIGCWQQPHGDAKSSIFIGARRVGARTSRLTALRLDVTPNLTVRDHLTLRINESADQNRSRLSHVEIEAHLLARRFRSRTIRVGKLSVRHRVDIDIQTDRHERKHGAPFFDGARLKSSRHPGQRAVLRELQASSEVQELRENLAPIGVVHVHDDRPAGREHEFDGLRRRIRKIDALALRIESDHPQVHDRSTRKDRPHLMLLEVRDVRDSIRAFRLRLVEISVALLGRRIANSDRHAGDRFAFGVDDLHIEADVARELDLDRTWRSFVDAHTSVQIS